MEQITRRDGTVYYGKIPCRDIEEAYERFRVDYHDSLGRDASRRLDRLGQRVERIHGYGFCFPERDKPLRFPRWGNTRYRILGLLGISYCRIVGLWDMPDLGDDEYDRWLDWVFSRGSGGLRLVGKKQKAGRTSKRLKKRYK